MYRHRWLSGHGRAWMDVVPMSVFFLLYIALYLLGGIILLVIGYGFGYTKACSDIKRDNANRWRFIRDHGL